MHFSLSHTTSHCAYVTRYSAHYTHAVSGVKHWKTISSSNPQMNLIA